MGEIENESPAPFEELLKKHEQLSHQQQKPLQQLSTLNNQKPTPYSPTSPESQRSGQGDKNAEMKADLEESDDDVEDIEDDEFDDDIEQDILPDKPKASVEATIKPWVNEQVQAVKATSVL